MFDQNPTLKNDDVKKNMKKIWLCKCLIRRSVLWSHQNILDWSNRKYRNHQESSNHVISPTDFPGWYGNSMKFHVFFMKSNWSSMKKNVNFGGKNSCMTLSNTKKSALALRWGTAYCSWCLYCWKAVGRSMSETDHFSQSLTAHHIPAKIVCPKAGRAKSSKPLPKEKSPRCE